MAAAEYRAYERAFNAQLGRNIGAARKKLGWSQARLAQQTGLCRPTVSRLERAARERTSIRCLMAIAAALGVNPTSLLPPL
jgi:transcriptional regulator with XRE-family HTH domain